MFTFLVLLIPCVLIFSCIHSKEKVSGAVSGIGFLLGVIFCAACAFSSFKHRIPDFNLTSNIIYYTVFEYVVPVIVLFLIYFFGTKDSFEFRTKAFFPLCAGFYSVYMPYVIIASSYSAFTFFELFVKPVLVLSMLILASAAVLGIGKASCQRKIFQIILYSMLTAVILFVPPCLNSIWLLDVLLPAVFSVSVVY